MQTLYILHGWVAKALWNFVISLLNQVYVQLSSGWWSAWFFPCALYNFWYTTGPLFVPQASWINEHSEVKRKKLEIKLESDDANDNFSFPEAMSRRDKRGEETERFVSQ